MLLELESKSYKSLSLCFLLCRGVEGLFLCAWSTLPTLYLWFELDWVTKDSWPGGGGGRGRRLFGDPMLAFMLPTDPEYPFTLPANPMFLRSESEALKWNLLWTVSECFVDGWLSTLTIDSFVWKTGDLPLSCSKLLTLKTGEVLRMDAWRASLDDKLFSLKGTLTDWIDDGDDNDGLQIFLYSTKICWFFVFKSPPRNSATSWIWKAKFQKLKRFIFYYRRLSLNRHL